MSIETQNKGCIGKLVEAIVQIRKLFLILAHGLTYDRFVRQNMPLMSLIGLKTKPNSDTNKDGVWNYYNRWPADWKKKLKECYIAFAVDGPLPIANTKPISTHNFKDFVLYRNETVAREIFFAQIAHVLWLEIGRKVPWRLAAWSDWELSYLLSSKVYFETLHHPTLNKTVFGVESSSRMESTENMLSDPRIAYHFMSKEPEQKTSLIGKTPAETCIKISGWLHDYLFHNPGSRPTFVTTNFHKKNPMLSDRLKRYKIEPYEHPVYVTPGGCGSASSLFVDLARSVNIPLKKVNNLLGNPDNTTSAHAGLIFHMDSDKSQTRYLIHTDSLYTSHQSEDPCPLPIGTNRGVSLWNHVWLSKKELERFFAYSSNVHFFAESTFKQSVKYWEYTRLIMVCFSAVNGARGSNLQTWKNNLKSRGLTENEITQVWNKVIDTVKTYGGGDLNKGYQNLLDGPNSRHQLWCKRTHKCEFG